VTQEGRPGLGEVMWISRLRAVVLLLRTGGGGRAALRARLFGWRVGDERRWVAIVIGRLQIVCFISIHPVVRVEDKVDGERMDPLCYNTRKKTDKKE
jgi:hypothetical protein